MLSELQTFDTYIDNLSYELNEINIDNKIDFTLDMINDCDKIKFKLLDYGILRIFLLQNYKYNNNTVVHIKFKSNIISFDKFNNISINCFSRNYPFHFLIINSLLNKTCIVDDVNLYIFNTEIIITRIDENNIDSIIDEVWIIEANNNMKKIENYKINDNIHFYKYISGNRLDLIIRFIKKENISVNEPSYIILKCSNNINIKKDIRSKDMMNIMGSNFYWIKNITNSNELINNNYYNFYIELFDEFNNSLRDDYIIFSYLVYKN
jgi:hypothetical protein